MSEQAKIEPEKVEPKKVEPMKVEPETKNLPPNSTEKAATGAKAGEEPKDAVKHAAGMPLGQHETLSDEEAAKLNGEAAKENLPAR